MVDRDRVLGFLDVAGAWDPTLLFVLGGAVSVKVKGPVFDRLQHIGFIEKLGADRVFLSTHQAMRHLTEEGSMPK
jgi:hypothetical protein